MVIAMDFRLYFETPEGAALPPVSQADLVLESEDESAAGTMLTYRGGQASLGVELKVQVRMRQQGVEQISTLAVEAIRRLRLVRVQFPYVERAGVESYDHLLVGSPWGDDIPNPARTIAGFCSAQSGQPERPGRLQFIRPGLNEVFYAYPGILAMQYAVLYNPAAAFYLACYGTGDESRALAAGAPGAGRLALSFNHYPFLQEGSWESPPCAIAQLPGGWHAAADLYASHMGAVFTSPDTPPWLRSDFHGWVQIMMLDERLEPFCRYRDLPEIYQQVEAAGLNILHVAGWNAPYFDARYPDFDLNPELGTAEELRAALAAIQARGGRVILYTNGRLVDPASHFFRKGGADCICLNRDLQPYLEQYGTPVLFNIACPDCQAYRDHFVGVIERLIRDYGAQGAQIDQISCTQGFFCYDPSHAHPTPATNFLPGVERLLGAVRARHRQLDAEFFTWIEGCHERFGQYYDVEQGHGEVGSNWNIGELVPEMFHYTFPRRIVTGLSENVQRLCHTYAQGKPFDLYLENLQDKEFRALLGEFLALRRAHPEYFLGGVFRDCVGMETTGSVRAFQIDRAEGGGRLVNFWLPGASPAQACQALVKNPRLGWRVEALYPQNLKAAEQGDWLEVAWRGPVATLVLEQF